MSLDSMDKPKRKHTCPICAKRGKGNRLRRALKDRTHQVPELAGYNKDGSVLYIDRRLPMGMAGVDVDAALEVHEEVENALEFRLGFSYAHAHMIATEAERCFVEMKGWDWEAYDKEMQGWIKKLENNYDSNEVPEDLINPNKVEGK